MKYTLKFFSVIICLFASSQLAKAQDSVGDTTIYTIADKMPQFPGGSTKLNEYIISNLKYPKSAMENEIVGKPIISFIVEKDGTISQVTAVKRVGWGMDEEAIRIVKNMPNWEPGIQNGEKVRIKYYLPIQFDLM